MSQTIPCLRRILWHGRNGGLAKHVYSCARGIGTVAEQLRFSGCAAVHRPAFYRSAFEKWRPRLFAQSSEAATNAMPGGIARQGGRVLEPMAWKRRTGQSGI
ncbi:hypothetical protein E0H56_20645 [Rhizobium leguminosarum bv. viciae]|nr:hypothetical protein E0H56_20645 [Rhizobium leguminosarum bv. viciae]